MANWVCISDVVVLLTNSVNQSDTPLKGGDKLSPSLESKLILRAEFLSVVFFKMHKRYAEFGSYIGTNCPYVELIYLKLKESGWG